MPRDGTIIPLFGTGVKGFSQTVSSQLRRNVYVEFPKDPEKGPIAVYGRPGLSLVATLVASSGPSLTRAMFESFSYETPFDGLREIGVIVCGNIVNSITPGTSIGNFLVLTTNTGPVGIIKNPTQLLIADGAFGYSVDVTAGFANTVITSGWFPNGATSVAFINGRGVAVEPNSGRFWYSALNDFASGGAANFYTAESDPDDLRVVWNHFGQLAMFGKFTTEFWASGSGTTIFQRVGGTALEWGIAAVRSVKKIDRGTIFLGQNQNGDKKVLLMQGYQVQPISIPEIEFQLQSQPVEAGIAAAYTINGHTFYRLSFPDKVFVYDVTSNTWNDDTTGSAEQRGIGQLGCLIAGTYLVSDYRANGRIYKLDPDVYTDAGETIIRESITKHVFHDYDRVSVEELGLDFEVGVGLQSGQGVDPKIMLQIGRDNGHTWGNIIERTLGRMGQYLSRVWAGPFGSSRDWLIRIRMSDPVKFALTGGAIRIRP
jgi:hypothetical protein